MSFVKLTIAGFLIIAISWLNLILAESQIDKVLWFERSVAVTLLVISGRLCLEIPHGLMKWLLAWGALICSMVFADIALTIAHLITVTNDSNQVIKARELTIPFDVRSKLEVLKELNAEDKTKPLYYDTTIYPERFIQKPLTARQKEFSPLGGVPHARLVGNNENGYYPTFTNDRFGFLNPDNAWNAIPHVDSVIIGDSFAHGVTVNKGVADYLRTNSSTVINLGYSSNGPMLELAILREASTYIKPQRFLWLYCEDNDLADLELEKHSAALLQYLNDPSFTQDYFQNFQREGFDESLRSFATKEVRDRLERSSLGFSLLQRLIRPETLHNLFFLQNLRHALRQSLGASIYSPDLPLLDSVLKKAKAISDSTGAKMLFVYLPSFRRFDSHDIKRLRVEAAYRDLDGEHEHILTAAKRLGIETIDITEPFLQSGDPKQFFPLRIEGHYTEEGYRIIADTIQQATNRLSY